MKNKIQELWHVKYLFKIHLFEKQKISFKAKKKQNDFHNKLQ